MHFFHDIAFSGCDEALRLKSIFIRIEKRSDKPVGQLTKWEEVFYDTSCSRGQKFIEMDELEPEVREAIFNNGVREITVSTIIVHYSSQLIAVRVVPMQHYVIKVRRCFKPMTNVLVAKYIYATQVFAPYNMNIS